MGPFIRHSTTVSGLNTIDVANSRRRFEVVANQAVATLVTGTVKMFNANTFTGTPVAANNLMVAARAA